MVETELEIALDNDVVLKAVCFRLDTEFWPPGTGIGVLGAARYVLAKAITRPNISGDATALQEALSDLLCRAVVLEPTDAEVALAADLVLLAQRHDLDVDTGEAQLAAMVIERSVEMMDTGDKRAIAAFEVVIDLDVRVCSLARRLRCLEQLVLGVLVDGEALERVRAGVCNEPDLDKALTICLACTTGRPITLQETRDALSSYVESLRREAPRILSP